MCTDLGFNERNFGEMSTDRFEAGYVQEESGASYRARKKGKSETHKWISKQKSTISDGGECQRSQLKRFTKLGYF